jgi:L-ribulose-5-phosphate 3-epimerase
VGSPIVQVYYDIANSWSNGYDVPGEIRMLGNDRICEIHLKDNGKDVTRFDAPNAMIDWPKVSQAIKDIGYDKWFTIEESGRKNRWVEDTQYNVAHAKTYLA